MDIQPVDGPWKVLGEVNGVKISVKAPGLVKIETGLQTTIVPIAVAIALQSEEAKLFLKSPMVVPFMYGSSERETRIRAAKLLAQRDLDKRRREFAERCQAMGADLAESWELAKLKYKS